MYEIDALAKQTQGYAGEIGIRPMNLRERLIQQRQDAEKRIANTDRLLALLDKNKDIEEILKLMNKL